MTLRVRCFEPSDYEAARALWQATAGVGLSAADERPAIKFFLRRNPGLSWVAHDEAVLVGTLLCGHDGRRGLIHHLVTASRYRRQGLARQLLRAGLNALCAVGIDKCHLLVFNSNADGLAFWRAVAATERTELTLFSLPTTAELPPA